MLSPKKSKFLYGFLKSKLKMNLFQLWIVSAPVKAL